jgi:hypothetical protein
MRANSTVHTMIDKGIEELIAHVRKAEFIDRGQGQYLDPSDVKSAFMGPLLDAIQEERLRPLTEIIRIEAENLLDELCKKGFITEVVRTGVDIDDLVSRVRRVLAPRLVSSLKTGQ